MQDSHQPRFLVCYFGCYSPDGYRLLDLQDSRDSQYYHEGQFHRFGEVVDEFDSLQEAESRLEELAAAEYEAARQDYEDSLLEES